MKTFITIIIIMALPTKACDKSNFIIRQLANDRTQLAAQRFCLFTGASSKSIHNFIILNTHSIVCFFSQTFFMNPLSEIVHKPQLRSMWVYILHRRLVFSTHTYTKYYNEFTWVNAKL